MLVDKHECELCLSKYVKVRTLCVLFNEHTILNLSLKTSLTVVQIWDHNDPPAMEPDARQTYCLRNNTQTDQTEVTFIQ